MSAAQRRYERYWTPVQFCTDRLQLSAQSKRRSAAFMPPIARDAPYCQRVRQIHSEFEGASDAEEG
jgi:hypothetical protein